MLENLKYIKIRAWENLYFYKIADKRNFEIRTMFKYGVAYLVLVCVNWLTPVSAMCAFLYVQIQWQGGFTVAQITTFLQVYFNFYTSVNALPSCI